MRPGRSADRCLAQQLTCSMQEMLLLRAGRLATAARASAATRTLRLGSLGPLRFASTTTPGTNPPLPGDSISALTEALNDTPEVGRGCKKSQ